MLAVIDIGTNTFNLLIGEFKNNKLEIKYNDESAVRLWKNGVAKNLIQPDAIKRGLETLQQYKKICEQFHAKKIIVIATETLRSASNSEFFSEKAKEILGSEIKIINGLEEADFIYHGAINSFNMNIDEHYLIIDIGGGSVEIIITKYNQKIFTKSYKAGALRLLEIFNPSNPVSDTEVEKINDFFRDTFSDLLIFTKSNYIKTLVGTAGCFDSLIDIIKLQLNQAVEEISMAATKINKNSFDDFYKLIIKTNTEQRKYIKGLADFRVDTIPMAALLMNYIINIFKLNNIIASRYALKEGVLFKSKNY